ncbi:MULTISPECIES: hypothetical protein [unclassified Sphingomonas]|jgi:hypothetical protein|nr:MULTISPECIES: hypothetical protein [unclassified Sphingomonas]
MLHRLKAVAFALAAPLMLASCLFVPGKFESALTIHADRSFTFAYVGEVMAVDLQGFMGKAMQMGMAEAAKEKSGKKGKTPEKEPDFTLTPEEKARQDENFRKLATEIARETGYRSVEYRGNGMFWIDYRISGTLDHSFVFPYNPDNQMIMPWIAVELRGKDLIRVKAPGYVRMSSGSGMSDMSALTTTPGGMGEAFSRLQGLFTLTTDAELVSQNNEEGAVTIGKDKTITWKTDPRTGDAPMASIRVRAMN